MRKTLIALLSLVIAAAGAVTMTTAGALEKGQKELLLRFSFSNIDFGTVSGIDFGERQDTDLGVSLGWLLTDNHELGISVSFSKAEIKNSDFGDAEFDSSASGGFYHFNFSGPNKVIPFFGFNAAVVGGDFGDLYDTQLGVEFGIKAYSFEHVAILASARYTKLFADAPGFPDADAVSLGVGIILNFGGGK